MPILSYLSQFTVKIFISEINIYNVSLFSLLAFMPLELKQPILGEGPLNIKR
jgi:hypothetical protein